MANSSEIPECEYQPQIFLEWKMIFVGMIGLMTAFVSVIHNSLLFWTFCTSRALRNRNLLYLMWISACDIFISISYVAIMCVQVYSDYYASVPLFIFWHKSLRPAFSVSHVTMSSASFLLMIVTMERYLQCSATHGRLFRFLTNRRPLVVLFCFLAGLLLKGTVYFEVAVVDYPECQGLASMGLETVQLVDSPIVDVIWKFWLRKVLTVLLPFVVLAYFNFAIVLSVRKTDRDQTVKALVLSVTVGQRGEQKRLRSRLRTVTRMLVMVVTCYLAANIIDVLIAFWETIDIESLQENPRFYTVLSDISSFLPILACALRLPIYACNDYQIRKEVVRKIGDCIARISCFCSDAESIRLKRKLYDGGFDEPFIQSPKDSVNSSHNQQICGIGTLIVTQPAYNSPSSKSKSEACLIEDTDSILL